MSVITDGAARSIAAGWQSLGAHGIRFASLASTGTISDVAALRNDISRELQNLETGIERRELLALDKYVRTVGERGAVAGWVKLWDDTPVSLGDC